MKTTVLFRMMVLVAMVVAGIANTELKAQDNNFITNEERVDDLVVSKVIYRLDGSLYRHMKYDFTYDDQKRMSSKEAFKWDASTEKWIPYFKIDYTYSSNEITLVYARWNDSHRAYDASVEKSVYELNDANMPVAYMNYKWNDKWIEEDYELDINGVYRALFVEKNRNGSNTSDTGVGYVLKYDGDHAIFREVAQARFKHGEIK